MQFVSGPTPHLGAAVGRLLLLGRCSLYAMASAAAQVTTIPQCCIFVDVAPSAFLDGDRWMQDNAIGAVDVDAFQGMAALQTL